MARAIQLSDDVRGVLERSVITGNSVRLPEGQLERPLYVAVDKVLKAAGGKWNRGMGVHVFPSDPREALGLALESGEITNQQQANQAFYTPADLANRIVQLADIGPGSRVLEPSAGEGALVGSAVGAGADIVAVEQNQKDYAILSTKFGDRATICLGDFLGFAPAGLGTFDAVVMNPPFTRGQEVVHVRHAMKFLKLGGVLVSVMSNGVTFRDTTAYRDLRDLGLTIIPLPDDSFKASGTGVRTVLVVYKKV